MKYHITYRNIKKENAQFQSYITKQYITGLLLLMHCEHNILMLFNGANCLFTVE